MTEDTSTVIELRQYTLHPGKREALISLFEERFIEPQRAAAMRARGATSMSRRRHETAR